MQWWGDKSFEYQMANHSASRSTWQFLVNSKKAGEGLSLRVYHCWWWLGQCLMVLARPMFVDGWLGQCHSWLLPPGFAEPDWNPLRASSAGQKWEKPPSAQRPSPTLIHFCVPDYIMGNLNWAFPPSLKIQYLSRFLDFSFHNFLDDIF